MTRAQDHPPTANQAGSARYADLALRLVEAQTQVEELIAVNQRLRAELSEVTLLWVNATDPSSKRA